jgi:hypothetical protein
MLETRFRMLNEFREMLAPDPSIHSSPLSEPDGASMLKEKGLGLRIACVCLNV